MANGKLFCLEFFDHFLKSDVLKVCRTFGPLIILSRIRSAVVIYSHPLTLHLQPIDLETPALLSISTMVMQLRPQVSILTLLQAALL